jgi:glycosyltransferase involved in cell wall biosynthesis
MLPAPRISVVMAVFNAERYLADAVESILHQSFRDFEFVILNDGSTDESGKISTGVRIA